MKQFFPILCVLACLLCLAGCTSDAPPPETEAETEAETETEAAGIHYPESFAVSDYDLSDARCVSVASCITGNTLFLSGQTGLDDILAAIQPLTGENPVSSQGIYGGAYVLAFYDVYPGVPQNTDIPILKVWIVGDSSVALYDTVYETSGQFTYPAMYTIDPEVGRALIAACREYLE